MAGETTRDKRAEIDEWMSRVHARACDLIDRGLTPEQAEEAAMETVRKEIRQS